jgi:hypothetical protein
MAGRGAALKSAWPFRKGCRVSGLELLRVETRQPRSEPAIWTDWWLGAGATYHGALKRWTGAAWIKESLKVFFSGTWQVKPLKRWSGTAWLEVDATGA